MTWWCHCYLFLKQTRELRHVSLDKCDHCMTCFILKSCYFKNQWASAANYRKSMSCPFSWFCIFPTWHVTFTMDWQHSSIAVSHGHPLAPFYVYSSFLQGRLCYVKFLVNFMVCMSLPYHIWILTPTLKIIWCCIFQERKKTETSFLQLFKTLPVWKLICPRNVILWLGGICFEGISESCEPLLHLLMTRKKDRYS